MSKFYELLNQSDIPILVDFYAEWCGPCKVLSPVLKELAGEMKGQVKILKVDVDRNPAVASQYGIRGVPTMILFHKGAVKWRQSGVLPKHELRKALQSECESAMSQGHA